VAAALVVVWNPWVFGRLVLGHWPMLLALAGIAWLVVALRDVDAPGGVPRVVLAFAVIAVAGASGWVIAATVTVVGCVVARPVAWRRVVALGVAGLVLAAPWAVPSLTMPGGIDAVEEGVAAFAAAADTPLGSAGSVVTLGGTWNRDARAPERGSPAGAALAVALSAFGVAGAVVGRRRFAVRTLAPVAVGAVALAVTTATGPGARVAEVVVGFVPAAGLLRDTTRYLAPAVVLVALGTGVALDRVSARAGTAFARRAATVAVLVLPVAALPSLAWGAGGRLATTAYPDAWVAAAARVDGDPTGGAALVLPWHRYVRPDFAHGRPVQQPMLRLLGRPAVTDADLPVGDRPVPGDEPYAARVAPVATRGGPLAAEDLAAVGVRWVVDTEPAAGPEVDGATEVSDGTVRLWRIPGPVAAVEPVPPLAPALLANVLAVLTVLGAAVALAWGSLSRSRP
jgi:hypothetical protein